MPPQQIISFIIGTILILVAAYYVTYYIGLKASGQSRAGMKNRNIVVRDRFSIARDKSFCVVEIAGKIYIIGITSGNMVLLDSYSAEEFEELTAADNNNPVMSWSDTPVGRYGNKLTKKLVAFVAAKTGKQPADDNIYAAKQEKSSFEESMDKAQKKQDEQ